MVVQGIFTPFQFNDSGGVKTADPLTKIKMNMQQVLSTPVTSRFMESNYGSGVVRLLGEQSDESFDALAKKEIRDAINRWITDVDVQEIEIQRNEGTSLIFIKYFITTFDVTDSLLLQIEG